MWFIYDAWGIMWIILTYSIVLFVNFSMVYISIMPGISNGRLWPCFHFVMFQCITVMIFWSHIHWMLSNPGCLPKGQKDLDPSKMREEAQIMQHKSEVAYEELKERRRQKQLEKEQTSDLKNKQSSPINRNPNKSREYKNAAVGHADEHDSLLELNDNEKKYIISVFRNRCRKWESPKPPNCHHCRTCKSCIARMDHHWPWVNNWVGIYNQKSFLLFWAYVWIGSFYPITVNCINSWHWVYDQCRIFLNPAIVCLNVAGMFFAVLFGTFTAIMFFDQISWITSDTSTIDKLKKIKKKVVFLCYF